MELNKEILIEIIKSIDNPKMLENLIKFIKEYIEYYS